MSAATGWEIATKASLGLLTTTRHPADAVAESGFGELPIRLTHAEGVRGIPSHHRDPFDRILTAQAQIEGVRLVTRDPVFARYGLKTLKA